MAEKEKAADLASQLAAAQIELAEERKTKAELAQRVDHLESLVENLTKPPRRRQRRKSRQRVRWLLLNNALKQDWMMALQKESWAS